MAQSTVPPRIKQAIDEQKLVPLAGNTHPLARAQYDRGAAPDDLPMERVLLVLQRGAEQEAELQQLLQDQQSKSSPHYHQWLTPEEFGKRFGPADADIAAVTNWLGSQGFRVNRVAVGRTVIEFSGTAAQVRQAFRTEIRKFLVNGEEHWANAGDPQIPAALAPVVRGFMSLHNFRKKPQLKVLEQKIPAKFVPGERPQVTSGSAHALGPGDFAVIYNTNPILQVPGPQTGLGFGIAVVARSNIDPSDVERFRSLFGLPPIVGQSIVLNGPDPGDLGGGEEVEAVTDASWSGAIAPNASVLLVVSGSTEVTDGIDLSELYIIDYNVAAVMTESFGMCEANATSAQAAAVSQLAEQAAAQGITYIVSTGDTGSAGCDDLSETQAIGPVSVNLLASTPFNMAVGGTEFNEHSNDSQYWGSTNSTLGKFTSALSYIPENVWNESCSVAQCGQANANIAAGGGGASTFFSKPAWQSGVTGIPTDGKRDIPDVALASAVFHDPYLICVAHSCDPDQLGNFFFVGVGGTSVAAQVFGGIMALVNGKVAAPNSPPRLGQVNRLLYALAAKENLSNCNGSSITGLPASDCIFNDITSGNNAVPGEANFGTPAAPYQSGVGYDLASGLGSVNVANLVNNWDTSFTPTTTTLSLNPNVATHGSPVQVNIQVTSPHGTPTGDVALRAMGSNGPFSIISPGSIFTLNSSGSASTSLKLLPGGLLDVTAHYAGDGNFDASNSTSASVNIVPENSKTFLHLVTLPSTGAQYDSTTVTYGSPYVLRADVTNIADGFHAIPLCSTGCPTGNVTIAANGLLLDAGNFPLNSLGYTEDQPIQLSASSTPYALHAAYQGDPSFKSSSADLSVTITQAQSATSLTANPSTGVTTATLVTLTAAVSTQSNSSAGPTGTITFFNNGTQIANLPVTSTSASGTAFAGGAASLQTTFTAATQSITAKYNGDTNYAASPITSPVSISVTQGPPTPVATASPVSVTAGGSANTTVTVIPTGGFTGQVTVSCPPATLPPAVTCNTLNVTVSGSTPVQGQLLVSVAAPSPPGFVAGMQSTGSTEYASLHRRPGGRKGWWKLSAGTGLAAIFLFVVPGRKRYRGTLCLWLICVLSLAIGCGGGSGNSFVSPTPIMATTTTRIAASQAKVPLNARLTFAVGVKSTGAAPTGMVQLFDGATPLGAPATLTNGVLEITTSSLVVGTHAISAHYLGDSQTSASQSGVLNVTVTGTTAVGIATNPSSNNNVTFSLTIN